MLVTIQQFSLPCDNLADGAYTLRCWYNQGFLDSSGQAVAPGTSTTGTQIRSVATVSGGFITFDPVVLYSTLDAEVPNPQSIQIACQLFKNNTALNVYPFQQNGTPSFWIIPDDLGATISFEEWTIVNQRIVLANPPLTFYTAAQVDALIEANNIQVAFNQDYVITAYPSLAAAVAAAAVTDGTLVINESTACPSNLSVPTNVTLRFTRKGSIVMTSAKTLTILGAIEADPVQIFFNATSGGGSVDFAGSTSIVQIYPNWWGVGTVDDADAFDAAFAQSGQCVFVPEGSYNIGSDLATPTCASIIGAGRDITTFLPAGVTTFLTVSNATAYLARFTVDGASTTNATGLVFGNVLTADNWAGMVEQVRVRRFTGTPGVGMRLGEALKSEFTECLFDGNNINQLIQEFSNTGSPTSTTFRNCQIIDAVTKGTKVVTGDTITWDGCIWDTNNEEGVLILPATNGTAVEMGFINNCRFEGNYKFNPTHYQFVAGDGTSIGGATIRLYLRNVLFAHGNNGVTDYTSKAVKLDGAAVAGFVLDNIQVPTDSGEIVVTTNVSGQYANFASNQDPSVITTDTSNFTASYGRGQIRFPITQNPSTNVYTLDDYRELTFTPSIVLGGGSVTLTTATGICTKIGRMATVHIKFVVNVATTPSSSVEIDGLPFTAANTIEIAADILGNNWTAGAVDLRAWVVPNTTTMRVFTFGSGSLVNPGAFIQNGTQIYLTATYEV
jgi:hypothetical protein